MKDKYIFSDGCPRCNGQIGDNWMTMKHNDMSKVTLGPGETIIFEDGQLKVYLFEQDSVDPEVRADALNFLEEGLIEAGIIS